MEEHSVLMLSYAFPPIASSGTFRVARFAKYLPDFGWRPIIVSVRPEHAIYNQVDPSLARLIPTDVIVKGTSVFRPLIAARKWTRFLFPRRQDNGRAGENRSTTATEQRMLPVRDLFETLARTPDRHVGWILPAVSASLPLIRKHRPSVILSSGPPHSAHLVAIMLKRLTGLPVVTDLRDPWARNPWESKDGMLRGRAQSLLERLCVRRANAVILNTDNARDEFESFYEGEDHGEFTVIPNGYDPDLSPCVPRPDASTRSPDTNGAVRLCHCGSVYGNRSLLPLVKAIAKLKKSGLRFKLNQVGVVAGNSELTDYLYEHDLEGDVRLDGQLPHDQALARMAAADILVAIQGGTDLQVPAKLFEMLPYRKPILALTETGPTAEIVRNYNLGIVANPNDHDAIVTALTRLSTGSLNAANGCEAQRALRDFDGRQLTGKLADVMRNCTQPRAQVCN